MLKKISLLVICFTICLSFSACNNKEKNLSEIDKNGKTEDKSELNNVVNELDDEMHIPTLAEGDTVFVLAIDDYKVSYNEFRYYFMGYKKDFDKGDESFWNDNDKSKEELSVTIVDSIKMALAVKQISQEENLMLTDEEKQFVKKAIDDMKAEYETEEKFTEFLEENYLTEALFREQEEIFVLMDKVKAHFIENKDEPLSEDEFFDMLYERMDKMKVIFPESETSSKTTPNALPPQQPKTDTNNNAKSEENK